MRKRFEKGLLNGSPFYDLFTVAAKEHLANRNDNCYTDNGSVWEHLFKIMLPNGSIISGDLCGN